jgi:hypothetical protein
MARNSRIRPGFLGEQHVPTIAWLWPSPHSVCGLEALGDVIISTRDGLVAEWLPCVGRRGVTRKIVTRLGGMVHVGSEPVVTAPPGGFY